MGYLRIRPQLQQRTGIDRRSLQWRNPRAVGKRRSTSGSSRAYIPKTAITEGFESRSRARATVHDRRRRLTGTVARPAAAPLTGALPALYSPSPGASATFIAADVSCVICLVRFFFTCRHRRVPIGVVCAAVHRSDAVLNDTLPSPAAGPF